MAQGGTQASSSSTAELILLGTQGGPNYGPSRSETANALRVGENLFLIDCGYGTLASMVAAGLHHQDVDAIFLTHLHDDHSSDLFAILTHMATQSRNRDVVIYGPTGTQAYVNGLRAALTPNAKIRILDEARPPGFLDFIKAVEVTDGDVPVQQNGVRISCAQNTHYPASIDGLETQGSLAFRFDWGDSIVFSGDTTYSENLVALARGADVFVCEVLEPVAMRRAFDAMVAGGAFAGAEEGVWRHMVDTHASPTQVGQMAAEAGVERVVLTHLAPGALLDVPDSTYVAGVAERFSGPIIVAEDGMVVPL
nr:MBL fold metallo-hydrolase [Aurantiacibacter rhizosphaerae]